MSRGLVMPTSAWACHPIVEDTRSGEMPWPDSSERPEAPGMGGRSPRRLPGDPRNPIMTESQGLTEAVEPEEPNHDSRDPPAHPPGGDTGREGAAPRHPSGDRTGTARPETMGTADRHGASGWSHHRLPGAR